MTDLNAADNVCRASDMVLPMLFYKAVCRWCIGQPRELRRKAESVNRYESRVMLLNDLTFKVGSGVSVLQPSELRDLLLRRFRQARSLHDDQRRCNAEGK